MSRQLCSMYSVLGLCVLLASGCGCFASGRWHPFAAPPAPALVAAPVPITAPMRPVEASPPPQAPKPATPAELPKRAEPKPVASVEPAPTDRAKKITSARGDLQTGLTALTLRAVTVCASPGAAACLENQGLTKQARDLDEQLAAALLDPQLAVNWAEVTTVLRGIVDSAMKGKP